jgi:ubiquinone/menaquinone biosynthesis C-methylase UbiE
MVAAVPQPARILDVGVGTGFYLGQLAPSARLACGLDLSAGMLRVARARLGTGALLVQADARAMPFRAAAFDLLLLNRVASHVRDLGALVASLARVLAPGGRLVVSDLAPEHDYLCTELGAPEGGILVETYKHRMEDWRRAAAPAGLRIAEAVTLAADTLAWLPPHGFSSIERGSRRPIGFVLSVESA